jgi:hypothetical protein
VKWLMGRILGLHGLRHHEVSVFGLRQEYLDILVVVDTCGDDNVSDLWLSVNAVYCFFIFANFVVGDD